MAAKKHKMFIGGKWVDAINGKTFDDMNPYTGEVYAQIPAGKREGRALRHRSGTGSLPGVGSHATQSASARYS